MKGRSPSTHAVIGVLTVLVVVQVVWNLAALERDYRPTLREILLADMLGQGPRLEIIELCEPGMFCLSLSSSWGRF